MTILSLVALLQALILVFGIALSNAEDLQRWRWLAIFPIIALGISSTCFIVGVGMVAEQNQGLWPFVIALGICALYFVLSIIFYVCTPEAKSDDAYDFV